MAIDFPNSPTTNQEFTSSGRTWVYDGSKWTAKTTQGNLVADAPPSTAAQGQIWVNATTARSYVYISNTWVEIANAMTTGAISTNLIINGNFDVWQRGTSFSSNGYVADRWASLANDSVSRQAFSSVPEVPNAQYYIRLTPVQVGGYHAFQQPIENGAVMMSGKTVTLSFWARSNTGNSWTVQPLTALYVNDNQQVWNSAALTPSWQKFTFTMNIPTTNGTDTTRYLRFVFPDTSINYGMDLAQVQMEISPVATDFRRAGGTIQGELAACKRYYQRYYGAVGCALNGVAYTTGSILMQYTLPTEMRTSPSLSASGNITISDQYIADWTTASPTVSPQGNNAVGGRISLGGFGTSLTVGRYYSTPGASAGSGYIEFNAEL